MTKIYTLSILFCLSVFFASAQFDIGQKVIGGNVGFNGATSEYYNSISNKNNTTNISASPSIAWFTKANQLFGIGLQYNYNHEKSSVINYPGYSDTISSNSHSIGVNMFSQRFIPLAHNFYFTVTATGSAWYSFGKRSEIRTANELSTRTTGYGIRASLAPGLTYRLTQRFLFDAYLSDFLSAGYTHSQYKNGDGGGSGEKPHQNTFNLSSSLSNTSLGNIGLGFRWLLKK